MMKTGKVKHGLTEINRYRFAVHSHSDMDICWIFYHRAEEKGLLDVIEPHTTKPDVCARRYDISVLWRSDKYKNYNKRGS